MAESNCANEVFTLLQNAVIRVTKECCKDFWNTCTYENVDWNTKSILNQKENKAVDFGRQQKRRKVGLQVCSFCVYSFVKDAVSSLWPVSVHGYWCVHSLWWDLLGDPSSTDLSSRSWELISIWGVNDRIKLWNYENSASRQWTGSKQKGNFATCSRAQNFVAKKPAPCFSQALTMFVSLLYLIARAKILIKFLHKADACCCSCALQYNWGILDLHMQWVKTQSWRTLCSESLLFAVRYQNSLRREYTHALCAEQGFMMQISAGAWTVFSFICLMDLIEWDRQRRFAKKFMQVNRSRTFVLKAAHSTQWQE